MSQVTDVVESVLHCLAGMQVASEWGQAKAEASQAKAAGDKNKQKSIGQVIRSLKQEMKAIGVPLCLLSVSE